jgi:archaellum biogenesis protein FlaJ (TadC family)
MEAKTKYSLKDSGTRIPFEVPENYFEDFASRIEAMTIDQQVPVKRMLKPWIYMAAMFTGLLLMGNIVLNVHKSRVNQQNEAYEMYLMSQLDESVYYDYYLSSVTAGDESAQTDALN